MAKHTNRYRIYNIDQDLIDFLRGDGNYADRPFNCVDKQIYSHYGQTKSHSDKYIGIIIEFQQQLYFAPLTHDGQRLWLKRDDTSDFEIIYNDNKQYLGSLLLCKALPLTYNLIQAISFKRLSEIEGVQYSKLCEKEVDYLNSEGIHDRIQTKILSCIYGKQTPYQNFRVDYNLVIKNVKEYNQMLEQRNREKCDK